jgi:hypothetical protein
MGANARAAEMTDTDSLSFEFFKGSGLEATECRGTTAQYKTHVL